VLLGILAAIVAADLGSMVVLYAVAVGLGAAEVLFDTAAQTLMPSLVDRDDLSRANGRLFAAELVGNQLAGPPLGGFVFALGAALAFGSEAGLYAVAAAVLLFVRGSYRSERTGPRQTLLTDIGEGLRFLLGHRVLRTLALVLGVQNLLNTATMAIFVLYAVSRDGLGLSSFGVGLVLTSGAFGGLVGSLVASRLEASVGRARLLVIAVVVLAGATAVPGITTNIVAVCASFVISALFGVAWNVVTVSLRQRIIPNAMLGRVNSGYRMVGWGTMPIGAALGGLIGQVLGLRAVFLLAGAGTLACVVPLLAGAKESDIALAEAATPGTL
jgi:MFS family permease